MSEIKIRPAVIADSGDICGLNARELGYDYPQEKTKCFCGNYKLK